MVRRARAVMLDFDGPVCSAFAGYPAPQVARDMLARSREAGVPVSTSAAAETDPMEVLRYLFTVAPERQAESDQMLRDAEVLSVKQASATPGAVDFMRACQTTGRPIVIVSNNAPEAVTTFLEKEGLSDLIDAVFGRSRVSPELMKPHPHLLGLALEHLSTDPADCLMVGDSATDIEVAQTMGVPTVAYADRPGKAERFRLMNSDAVINDMHEIAMAIALRTHGKSRPLTN
ncbi:HAD superfamily hydrolase (TIGR01509 family)/HAD superfamily hydrolase (TIGR01549 family) [Allonocardiopsis opalescens]|uniref:HAD superfamily hydrolase (TIGR01509 family)/HAD superfamily hydrolase (TIGR01549 family) n=2 Tax=Allonocardiopsis opalescens TaxID=1144618 RepID=A0A2T0QA26_9ACTN|nr:HAD superfamily hydrolase (TIGR01509 family)/HAD superfamily hydrolase (TIGR01549 family) [Allonocardiopsis opalescens]